MIACRACGHPLDGGDPARCPGCGRPVDAEPDWRTDTAERLRPALPRAARLPPSAAEPPPPARWPLFADEVPPAPESAPESVSGSADPGEPGEDRSEAASWSYRQPGPTDGPGEWFTAAAEEEYADGPSPLRWVVATLLVVVLVGVGWWYLARDDGSSGQSGQHLGQHVGRPLGVGAGHVEVGDQPGR